MSAAEGFLRQAVALARDNVRSGGRPFGAVIVKDGAVIATGVNETMATNDPTAHAELLAIRAASHALKSPRLEGAVVYASGQPCPMCLAAMYMAGIREVAYAHSNDDGAPYGLTSAAVYAEMAKPLAAQSMRITHIPMRSEGEENLYAMWKAAARG